MSPGSVAGQGNEIKASLIRSEIRERLKMTAKKKSNNELQTMLVDANVPLDHRRQVLGHICMDTANAEAAKIVQNLLESAAQAGAENVYAKKLEELKELLKQMESGPLRYATFIKMIDPSGIFPRAHVIMQDGTSAFTVVPDKELAASLECGDSVLLEAAGKALLFKDPIATDTGEEARLERRIDAQRVEVSLRDQERCVFRLSSSLAQKLDSGEVTAGSSLLVCPRRWIAFDAVPSADGVSHYRFVVKDAVPDVMVERDIGSPPAYIAELTEHLQMEMRAPEIGRRYKLRRSKMKVLTGVSGSGKTLSIQGFWRQMYEVMGEITGVAVADLPARVVRLRMSEVLSKWLGESDRQLDRFFDEVEQLADEKFVAPDGTEYTLPVLAIGEEIDALARTRGGDMDGVYDRIQTTALQRLDTTCQKLKDKLIIFLFTTNVPHLVDPAFLRRAGGTMERFGRLTQRSFLAVMNKHLRGLPCVAEKGETWAIAQKRAMNDVTAWLFSPKGADAGQVELTYAGNPTPVVKYRRDFLTGALVDRAVQQAAAEACRIEREGTQTPGISSGMLIRAINGQVRSIVDQLHRDNVGNYITLPDGVRITNVRRIDQPAILPFDLVRAS